MDIIKEFKDVIIAIRNAVKDGKLTFDEAVAILAEVLDVLVLLVPYVKITTLKEQYGGQ